MTAGEGLNFEGKKEAILAPAIASVLDILVHLGRKKQPKVEKSCSPSVLKPCKKWTIRWFSSSLSRLWGTTITYSMSSQQSEQNCWCYSGSRLLQTHFLIFVVLAAYDKGIVSS